ASCITEEEEAIYVGNHEECVGSSGVDEAVLKTAYEGDIREDISFKNYINCFFTKSGFQDEKGEMRYDVIKSFVPHITQADDLERTITVCEAKKLVGETPADTAFLHFKCYMGKM
ncbi:PBP GOBP domain containing protein, partial [Asbolus verrucosus]